MQSACGNGVILEYRNSLHGGSTSFQNKAIYSSFNENSHQSKEDNVFIQESVNHVQSDESIQNVNEKILRKNNRIAYLESLAQGKIRIGQEDYNHNFKRDHSKMNDTSLIEPQSQHIHGITSSLDNKKSSAPIVIFPILAKKDNDITYNKNFKLEDERQKIKHVLLGERQVSDLQKQKTIIGKSTQRSNGVSVRGQQLLYDEKVHQKVQEQYILNLQRNLTIQGAKTEHTPQPISNNNNNANNNKTKQIIYENSLPRTVIDNNLILYSDRNMQISAGGLYANNKNSFIQNNNSVKNVISQQKYQQQSPTHKNHALIQNLNMNRHSKLFTVGQVVPQYDNQNQQTALSSGWRNKLPDSDQAQKLNLKNKVKSLTKPVSNLGIHQDSSHLTQISAFNKTNDQQKGLNTGGQQQQNQSNLQIIEKANYEKQFLEHIVNLSPQLNHRKIKNSAEGILQIKVKPQKVMISQNISLERDPFHLNQNQHQANQNKNNYQNQANTNNSTGTGGGNSGQNKNKPISFAQALKQMNRADFLISKQNAVENQKHYKRYGGVEEQKKIISHHIKSQRSESQISHFIPNNSANIQIQNYNQNMPLSKLHQQQQQQPQFSAAIKNSPHKKDSHKSNQVEQALLISSFKINQKNESNTTGDQQQSDAQFLKDQEIIKRFTSKRNNNNNKIGQGQSFESFVKGSLQMISDTTRDKIITNINNFNEAANQLKSGELIQSSHHFTLQKDLDNKRQSSPDQYLKSLTSNTNNLMSEQSSSSVCKLFKIQECETGKESIEASQKEFENPEIKIVNNLENLKSDDTSSTEIIEYQRENSIKRVYNIQQQKSFSYEISNQIKPFRQGGFVLPKIKKPVQYSSQNISNFANDYQDNNGAANYRNNSQGNVISDNKQNKSQGPQRKKITIYIEDTCSDIVANHQLNKTLRNMAFLVQFIYKTKEYTNSLVERAFKSMRYFGIPIQKQYKFDMVHWVKQKEFIQIAKEKMTIMVQKQVNKENQISDSMLNQQTGTYKYYIGTGNNHMLVKQIFKQRSYWSIVESENFEDCHFIWTQWLKDKHIQALQPLNGQQQEAINSQDAQEYSPKPTTQQVPSGQEEPLSSSDELNSSTRQPHHLPANSIHIYNKMHLNFNLSDKKHLFFNMRDFYQQQNKDPFNILPLTFVINDGLEDPEFQKFEHQFNQNQMNNEINAWIVKPGENTNRGCGIIVTKNFDEIKQLVREKSEDTDRTAIIQKYIENPLLINKRKFDIRCYGVLTRINGLMRGYFYQDGYLRTSSKEFNVQNLANKYIHLTNDAIQKHSDDYGKFENANKLSYTDFDKYFADFQFPIAIVNQVPQQVSDPSPKTSTNVQSQSVKPSSNTELYDIKFQRDFVPQIRSVVHDTFLAVEGKIDPEKRQNTFEIFGYDFMITDQWRLQLIEVNTNPCLEVCCPLLARIIPNLIDSVFKVAIDPLFPPNNKKTYNISGGEVMSEIKLELVFESNT